MSEPRHDRASDAPPPYGAVAFDCDSTLSTIEGIDELAGDLRAEIEDLTSRAMAGEIPLEEVYAGRLERLQPSRSMLEAVGRLYVENALPHARELVRALHSLGKEVWIVSGGLRVAVLCLGAHLELPPDRVLAVETHHGPDGEWRGWAADSPLAKSGGKPEVLARIARGVSGALALVGDGITDLEAAPLCRRFVAFGGVVQRPPVFARAAVGCTAPDLAALLPWLASEAEIAELEREGHGALVAASRLASGPRRS